MNKPLLETLKDWSGVLVGGAALLYVFGFTVHWAYFRLLGIDSNPQPLDYLRFAADYSTSIVSSIPQLLFALPYYSPQLVHPPLRTPAILSSLVAIVFLAFSFWRRAHKPARKRKPVMFMILWWGLNLFIVVSFYVLLQTEFNIAKVRDILQPLDAAQVHEMQNQLLPEGNRDNATPVEVRANIISGIYEHYTMTQQGSPGYYYFNEWFVPTVRPHNSTERRAVYLGLLLLNLFLLLFVILQLRSLKSAEVEHETVSIRERIGPSWSRGLTAILYTGLLLQLFLFPFVYSTLGRNLTYPIVMLKLSTPSKKQNPEVRNENAPSGPVANASGEKLKVEGNGEVWTHPVYLIADSDNEVIVFDRLNFFQVKRVPRARILTISQLSAASLFESCSAEEFKFTPCEILWTSEQTPIVDF